MEQRRRLVAVVLAVTGTTLGICAAPAVANGPAAKTPAASSQLANPLAAGETALVRLQVSSRAEVDSLVASGTDLAGPARALSGGAYQIDAVLTGAQLSALMGNGARLTQVIERQGDGTARYTASVRAAAARTATGLHPVAAGPHTATTDNAAPQANADTLHFLQAYWWTQQRTDLRRRPRSRRPPPTTRTSRSRCTWTTADGADRLVPARALRATTASTSTTSRSRSPCPRSRSR